MDAKADAVGVLLCFVLFVCADGLVRVSVWRGQALLKDEVAKGATTFGEDDRKLLQQVGSSRQVCNIFCSLCRLSRVQNLHLFIVTNLFAHTPLLSFVHTPLLSSVVSTA